MRRWEGWLQVTLCVASLGLWFTSMYRNMNRVTISSIGQSFICIPVAGDLKATVKP